MTKQARIASLDLTLKSAFRNLKSAILASPLPFALSLVCAVLFAFCAFAEAQQVKKVYRIGCLSSTDRATDAYRSEPFRAALRELGYIEGQNLTIEYRYAEGKRDRQPELAAELVRLKVALIAISGGGTVIRAAMNATKTIPIVMMGQGGDPIKEGFVASFARPGGNVTGFTFLTTELGGKRLELLKQAIPKLHRVVILYDPRASGIAREVTEDLPVAARALGLAAQPWQVQSTEEIERSFATLKNEPPDGLYAPSAGPLMTFNQFRIADFALKNRLPSLFSNKQAVEAGGLMYYGVDVGHSYKRVAYYVDRILKGAKPADLPVEQPTKFEFVINLKTAKQIGLTIPPNVLARADRVIR
jgi:putative ABC transport system substrate-binding protein